MKGSATQIHDSSQVFPLSYEAPARNLHYLWLRLSITRKFTGEYGALPLWGSKMTSRISKVRIVAPRLKLDLRVPFPMLQKVQKDLRQTTHA